MKTTDCPKSAHDLAKVLSIEFSDIATLKQALLHRSYVNEALEEDDETNERLEFLGDSILGLVVSHELYKRYPTLSEGHLSQLRAMLVRWDTLARVADRIGLGDYLMLGRGEELSGGRQRPSNLACAVEAVIGAAFLDGGLSKSRRLILHLLKPELAKIAADGIAADSKSRLQQVAQARWHKTPKYRLLTAEGPDHAKVFTVEVIVGDQALGRGRGRNKKQAELAAAGEALEALPAAG